MNISSRAINQSNIQYNDQFIADDHRSTSPAHSHTSAQWSSPSPSRRRRPRKESTKSWVQRTFYTTPGATARKNNPPYSPPPNYRSDEPKPPERKKKKVESTPTDEKDAPSISFSQLNIEEGAEVFKFCLVGKFPRRRPSLDLIRDWARKEWKLRGGWSITLLDPSHVFIQLDNEEDMIKVWPRSRWFVGGNPMKVFKWVPTFRGDADVEPSTAAVWISLPMLPVVLFQEKFLYQVAGLVGKAVTMDRATKNLSRTNVARVCVEVDLAKKLPNRVKIEIADFGFWQDVVYEKLPYYCTHCSKQGHSTNICKVSKLPDEKIDDIEQEKADCNTVVGKLPDEKIDEIEQEKTDCNTVVGNQSLANAVVDLKAQTCPDILNMSGRKKRVTITEAVSYHTGGSRVKKRKGKSMFDRTNKGRDKSRTGFVLGDEVIGTSAIGIMLALHSTAISRKRAMLEEVENESDEDESPKVQSQALQKDHLSVTNTKMKSAAARKKLRLRSMLFFWKRKEKAFDNFWSSPNSFADLTTRRFTLAEIKRATEDFNPSRIVGRGGFGSVYKGTIDEIEVAVKSLSSSSKQGAREFEAEVLFLSKLSHKNLVKLIGYCIHTEYMIVVYEFIPRGNLKDLSYGNTSNLLSWKKRIETCLGAARGLCYLHENGVMHRDIKTTNLLIDEDYETKISDLGLSKQQSDYNYGYSTTMVAGTPGYLDPEYFHTGRVTTQSDVYSFGVILFEVLCGKPPISDSTHIAYWARSYIKDGNVEGIVDPHLSGYVKTNALLVFVGLARSCVSVRAHKRPTMMEVVKKLELVLELQEGGGDLPSTEEGGGGDLSSTEEGAGYLPLPFNYSPRLFTLSATSLLSRSANSELLSLAQLDLSSVESR